MTKYRVSQQVLDENFSENLKSARNYSTSSVSSSATDYQHSRRAVLAWAVGPCGVVLKGLKDSTRRYANYAVDSM